MRKNKLLENFSALAIMQLMNYALPFVTLPYLVRILGMENYGAYLFSQALIAYFMIFVDFGFDLYATKEVAINRDNKSKLEEIISTVFIWKFLFLGISFVVILALTTFIPVFKEFQILHILNFGMILGTMLFANFYYQGIENMKFITILNASSKIFFTVLLFVFVKNTNDLMLTALINSGGYILVGLTSVWIIHKKHGLQFRLVSKNILVKSLMESLPFFWSRIAVSMYTVSNTFVIGLVLGNAASGIFGSADKIFRGIVALYAPLNTIFYPYIAHQKNVVLYKKVMKYAIVLNIIMALAVFASAEWVIQIIFGAGFEESVLVLRIFCVVLLYIMPSILIGYPLLGGMGHTKEVNLSVIYPAILHVLFLIIAIPYLNVALVAILVLITELLVFLYRSYYVKKYKLLC
ncbi:flippase [Lysinibacillus xylanilyticus]|uniref:flippase n=1 Tax=Lysinibacillus xylanilyticus TaxID=582475 RepID=UPI002B243A50|nr:flippase [Lysinibacillus xylanilyticus]MEB2298035.1 flippase [Lysinibacillus xylanilyticus]